MLLGLAHVAVCVPDVEAAVAWYESVLGLTVLSPPYLIEGTAIEHDMGELLRPPVALKAAIVGLEQGDHVLEVIEYPNQRSTPAGGPVDVTRIGLTHVGLICDDLDELRARLVDADVELLTSEVTDVAGVRTAWFRDPWGIVFILVEKTKPDRPYWQQW